MNRYQALALVAALFSSAALAAKDDNVARTSLGTTVVVEQDAAMGLNLVPWKDEFSIGLDQAPTLYRASLSPLNDSNLQRQTEYRDNLTEYRRSHSQYTP